MCIVCTLFISGLVGAADGASPAPEAVRAEPFGPYTAPVVPSGTFVDFAAMTVNIPPLQQASGVDKGEEALYQPAPKNESARLLAVRSQEPPATRPAEISQVEEVDYVVDPVLPEATQQQTVAALVVSAMNNARGASELPALQVSDGLTATAGSYAATLAVHGTLTHRAGDGCDVTCRFDKYDTSFTSWGENLGWWQAGSMGINASTLSDGLMTEWLRSSGHRDNIFSPEFTATGVGVVRDGNEWFVVVHFGGV